MPAPYGVTPEGFNRPSQQELLALIEADQLAEISTELDVSTDQILGQVNGIFSRHLAIAWEALVAAYDAFDPDRAEDDRLTSLSKLTGTERRGASKSELSGFSAVSVTLDIGTVLEAGVHFAHVVGKPDIRFTPQADYTAALGGDHFVDFEAESTGPVPVLAGTLTVIATPVSGWSAVTNPQDATLGRNIDSNAVLRTRREQGLARSGSSSIDAVRADVLAVADVTTVQVFENYEDATDANGVPGKSFEVVLWDDAGADDDAVAQAIWDSKAGGIRPYGSASGTALDRNGTPQTMYFSRAASVLAWLEFDIVPRDSYVGAAAFKLAVATALDAELGTGDDVGFYDVLIATEGLGAKVTAVRIGTSASPTTDADIAIGNRQIARFDTSRILVTV